VFYINCSLVGDQNWFFFFLRRIIILFANFFAALFQKMAEGKSMLKHWRKPKRRKRKEWQQKRHAKKLKQ
jgi:hypothetical protein